jgi:hypothetical protein
MDDGRKKKANRTDDRKAKEAKNELLKEPIWLGRSI